MRGDGDSQTYLLECALHCVQWALSNRGLPFHAGSQDVSHVAKSTANPSFHFTCVLSYRRLTSWEGTEIPKPTCLSVLCPVYSARSQTGASHFMRGATMVVSHVVGQPLFQALTLLGAQGVLSTRPLTLWEEKEIPKPTSLIVLCTAYSESPQQGASHHTRLASEEIFLHQAAFLGGCLTLNTCLEVSASLHFMQFFYHLSALETGETPGML